MYILKKTNSSELVKLLNNSTTPVAGVYQVSISPSGLPTLTSPVSGGGASYTSGTGIAISGSNVLSTNAPQIASQFADTNGSIPAGIRILGEDGNAYTGIPSSMITELILTSGTVTSVAGSGGTTGLTLNGGPITTTGTLTLGGTLVPANGGTGLAAPIAANAGKVLAANALGGYTLQSLSNNYYNDFSFPLNSLTLGKHFIIESDGSTQFVTLETGKTLTPVVAKMYITEGNFNTTTATTIKIQYRVIGSSTYTDVATFTVPANQGVGTLTALSLVASIPNDSQLIIDTSLSALNAGFEIVLNSLVA